MLAAERHLGRLDHSHLINWGTTMPLLNHMHVPPLSVPLPIRLQTAHHPQYDLSEIYDFYQVTAVGGNKRLKLANLRKVPILSV